MGLAKEILDRRYKPWKVRFFVVTVPKPREIVAAHLRDRVVHHLIYERLAPLWEARFSKHSYACRVGKGPLQATKILAGFLKLHRTETLYYLKMDIANFFQSINRDILRKQLAAVKVDNETEYLIEETLAFDQVSHCEKMGSHWDKLPPHKSLFNVPKGIGLPIGNLTSQFFANVYLDDMEHWLSAQKVDHELLFCQRYVDDFLVIGRDPKRLANLASKFNDRLQNTLEIRLNPTKTEIQPVCRGIDHLGFIHKPTHLRIRNRVKASAKRVIMDVVRGPRELDENFLAQVNSYLGIMGHADTMRLRRRLVTPLTSEGTVFTRYDVDAIKVQKKVLFGF